MIPTNINSLLNEIKQFLNANYQNLDFKNVEDLILKFRDDLHSCIKPNEKILILLKDKKNFRTLSDLQNFAIQILGKRSKFTKRRDIELNLAILLTQKKIGIEKLLSYIKSTKSAKPAKKRKPAEKRRKEPSKKTPTIPDQVKRWMFMKLKDVETELNNINKYPDTKSLKQAGSSILKQEDKRKRKKEIVIKLIIRRLAEEQSILALGT
ncbi:MAG: hypothetical protein ACFFD2_11650 [Promethearchaeota archaeon]